MTFKTSTGLTWTPQEWSGWNLYDKKENLLVEMRKGQYRIVARATPQIVQAAAELERLLGNEYNQ